MKCLIWCNLQTWRAKLRNNQVWPYFLCDSVVLHDTGGATQQNTNYRLPTEQRCAGLRYTNYFHPHFLVFALAFWSFSLTVNVMQKCVFKTGEHHFFHNLLYGAESPVLVPKTQEQKQEKTTDKITYIWCGVNHKICAQIWDNHRSGRVSAIYQICPT